MDELTELLIGWQQQQQQPLYINIQDSFGETQGNR